MRIILAAVFFIPTTGGLVEASARETNDKYHVTSEEKAACGDDAERLCSSAYPDEEKLLTCLKQNRGSLSASCSTVFATGLKRRGL